MSRQQHSQRRDECHYSATVFSDTRLASEQRSLTVLVMSRARLESAAGRLAQAHRKDRPPIDAATEEKLRRDLAEARIAHYIEKTLAKFPPLTEEQRVRLAELLKPVRVNGSHVDDNDRTA